MFSIVFPWFSLPPFVLSMCARCLFVPFAFFSMLSSSRPYGHLQTRRPHPARERERKRDVDRRRLLWCYIFFWAGGEAILQEDTRSLDSLRESWGLSNAVLLFRAVMLDFLDWRPPSLYLPKLQASMLLNFSNMYSNFFFGVGPGYGSRDNSSRSGRIVITHWNHMENGLCVVLACFYAHWYRPVA